MRIPTSSSADGYPILSLSAKRSSCASGSGYVPTYPVGFCVAITIKGSGISYVTPSTVTLLSSIASSSADCVLGEARLISSASSRLHITRPRRNSNCSFWRLYILKPVMSEAMTSGVNWARLKLSPVTLAIVAASVVLPVPGTSSISTCEPESNAVNSIIISGRLPTITFSTSLTAAIVLSCARLKSNPVSWDSCWLFMVISFLNSNYLSNTWLAYMYKLYYSTFIYIFATVFSPN